MMDGQISITDYLKAKIISREVMDLTLWRNSQGKSQYQQIGDVVEDICKHINAYLSDEQIEKITNAVSVYVLNQSIGYMNYLRNQSNV